MFTWRNICSSAAIVLSIKQLRDQRYTPIGWRLIAHDQRYTPTGLRLIGRATNKLPATWHRDGIASLEKITTRRVMSRRGWFVKSHLKSCNLLRSYRIESRSIASRCIASHSVASLWSVRPLITWLVDILQRAAHWIGPRTCQSIRQNWITTKNRSPLE